NRRPKDVGGRMREVGPVVLADIERSDPARIGKDGLVDVIADHGIRRKGLTGLINGDVAEGVQPELEFRGRHRLLLASVRSAADSSGMSQGGVLAPTARTSKSYRGPPPFVCRGLR